MKKILEPFRPVPILVEKEGSRLCLESVRPDSIGRVKAFSGNFGVLVRALAYILAYGPGIRQATEMPCSTLITFACIEGRNKEIVNAFQMLANVISVEHGIFGGLPDPGAIRKDVASARTNTPKFQRTLSRGRWNLAAPTRGKAGCLPFPQGSELAETAPGFSHRHWARARTASAVRSPKMFCANSSASRPRQDRPAA